MANIHNLGNKNGKNLPQQQKIVLTPEDLAGQVVCKAENCHCTLFITAAQFVVVSQFSPKNPTGKDTLQNLPSQLFCKDCGTPMDPKSIQKSAKKEDGNGK